MAQSPEKTYRNLLRRCLAERQDDERDNAIDELEANAPEEEVFQKELLVPELHNIVAELSKTASKLKSFDEATFKMYRSSGSLLSWTHAQSGS